MRFASASVIAGCIVATVMVGGTLAEPGPAVPPAPEDQRAARAYAVFDHHCATCHQTGRTSTPFASGLLADILDIDALSRRAMLVTPGFPDASAIMSVVTQGHPAVPSAPAAAASSEQIEALRDWIKHLPADVGRCTARKTITPADQEASAKAALLAAGPASKTLRFFTIAHLWNACASADELETYRQATSLAVNGLSRGTKAVRLAPVDANQTLLAVDISALDWDVGRWQLLEQAYPTALAWPLTPDWEKDAPSAIPIIRADWLASVAFASPLYYSLLDIPKTLTELAGARGVDIDKNIRAGRAPRAIVRRSAATRGNRLIERHAASKGALWLTYDFRTSSGDQDLFAHPFGRDDTKRGNPIIQADAVRVVFTLPNGLFGFALFDGAGMRLDRAPPDLDQPLFEPVAEAMRSPVRPAGGCLQCHGQGLQPVKDDFRAFIASGNSDLPAAVRDAALSATPSASEMQLLMEGDNERYASALNLAGIESGRRIGGLDAVAALAARYDSGANLPIAAAEAGVGREAFANIIDAIPTEEAARLSRRLLSNRLSRGEIVSLFSGLKAGRASAAPLRPPEASDGLWLWTDRFHLRRDDIVTVGIETVASCYLTLISVDAAGRGTVLFPNEFEPDNLVEAGTPIRVPSAEATYQFRFKGEGPELVIGTCSASPAPPFKINHNFERERFTVLGNWDNFVRDSIEAEALARRDPVQAAKTRAAGEEAERRRLEAAEPSVQRRPSLPALTVEPARAAIVIGN